MASFNDLLGRRLTFPATYSSALKISSDGRIGLSIGDSVSIIYARDALQAPSFDPVSFQELLDETQRQAREVRTPAVCHVLVDDQPARALAWSHPSVLLSAPSAANGTLRRLIPPFSICNEDIERLEGSWGLSGTLWQVMKGCSRGVLHNSVGETNIIKHLDQFETPESDSINQRLSTRNRKQSHTTVHDFDDSIVPISCNGQVGKRREESEEHSPTSEFAMESKVHAGNDDKTVTKSPIRSNPVAKLQVRGRYSREIEVNSFLTSQEPDDVLCLSVFNLNAAAQTEIDQVESGNSARMATFVAFGFRNGAIVRRWNGKDSPLGQECRIWDSWTCSLETVETVDILNAPSSILAVGGASGNVRIFSLIWVPTSNDDDAMEVIPVWNGADSVLRGPVASFTFKTHFRAPHRFLLAIAVGNSVAGVRIDEISNDGRKVFKARVSLAYDAHYQSVSAVCFLPDGSVLSSSKDGSISRWKFEWDDNTEPCTPLGVVQQPSPDLDSVVAMCPTPSSLLLATLTTRPTVKGEIGEPAPVVKKKYHYLGRPTLLGILAYPIDSNDNERLEEALENSLSNIIERGKYVDIPLSLWDLELWLLANKQHLKFAEAVLCEKYERVMSCFMETKWRRMRTRLRKVAHCIAIVLQRCSADFEMKFPHIRDALIALRTSILADYHFGTLLKFSKFVTGQIAESVSQFERESLVAKHNFVMSHVKSLELEGDESISSLEAIGSKLLLHFGETTRKYSLCEICEDTPLVAGSGDPTIFWCANGDYFPRCVVTALPTTDCVPRFCSGCDQRATTHIVHYPWSPDMMLCPMCNCELLQGRAESTGG